MISYLKVTLSDGTYITFQSSYLVGILPDRTRIEYVPSSFQFTGTCYYFKSINNNFTVIIPWIYRENVSGLCGQWTNSPSDSFILRNGSIIQLSQQVNTAFAQSWEVNPNIDPVLFSSNLHGSYFSSVVM
jgi:hypothetical protein